MKIKKEYFILAGIIILLSLYLVFYESDKTNYELPEIPDIEKKSISKIEVAKAGSTIVLDKKDDDWTIAPKGYPADSKKIDNMLDILDKLAVTDMISDKKSYERYDLNDDKKVSVNAFDGDTLKLAFDIGKTAPSHRHTFVKLKDDPRVYYANENFRAKFDETIDKLRDKGVLSFSKNDIQALSITKAKKEMAFQRNSIPVEIKTNPEKEGEETEKAPETKLVWQDKDGNEIDESKINRLMSSLSNLKCKEYMEDNKKDALKDPIYSITLKGAEEHTLYVYAKEGEDAEDYPAVSSQNNYAFLLTGSSADNFMKIFDEEKKEDK